MASRDQRRKSTERAWFITAPLALLAIVFSTAIGVLRPEFGEWGLAFVLFVAMTGISIPVLNFVVRRQTFSATFTEIPLVVALYYLPPLTVVLVATLAALIGPRRAGSARPSSPSTSPGPPRRPRWPGWSCWRCPRSGGSGPAPGASSSRRSAPSPWSPSPPVVGVITSAPGLAGRARGGPHVHRAAAGSPRVNATVGLIVLIALTDHLLVAAAARPRVAVTVAVVYRSYAAVPPPAPHPRRHLRADPGHDRQRPRTARCRTPCSAGSAP